MASSRIQSENGLPPSVQSLQNGLGAVYRNRQFSTGASTSAGERYVEMDDIFVDVHIVSLDGISARIEGTDRLCSYTDLERLSHASFSTVTGRECTRIRLANILKEKRRMRTSTSKMTFRVMATSWAGGGKTLLLTMKAPYDWALGRLWREIKLLFVFNMREIRKAMTTLELLDLSRYHPGISQNDQTQVINYISENPERMCIIIDGLDEVQFDDCSCLVRDVIAGARLPGIRLILTSRYSVDAMQLIQHRDIVFHRHIQLVGLEKGHIERYISTILPTGSVRKLLAKLDSNPPLSAVMDIPFVAHAVCQLHRSNADLPDTLGTVCDFVILNALQQDQKQVRDMKDYITWDDVPGRVKQDVAELGYFAFQMLIRKKTTFTEADFRMFEIPASSRSLGLLVAMSGALRGVRVHWQFSRLIFQEALAAYYVAGCNLNEDDVARIVQGVGGFAGHLKTFWGLLAASLKSECADALLQVLLDPTRLPAQTEGKEVGEGAEGHTVTHFLCTRRDAPLTWAEHLAGVLSLEEAEELAEELLGDKIGYVLSAPDVL
eukprot:scpid31504/ scgid7162/ Nucleotide-binding oligomerization domain-containing protein 2; Caspase recruitment domain-containing protein 15